MGRVLISKRLDISTGLISDVIQTNGLPDRFDRAALSRTSVPFKTFVLLALTVTLHPAFTIAEAKNRVLQLGHPLPGTSACRRLLRAHGIVQYRRVYRPLLKPKHIAARIPFCLSAILYPEWANNIIFTDESYVDFTDDGQWLWCSPGEKAHSSSRPKVVQRYLVWSAVGKHVGLMPFVVIPLGTMVDARLYRRIILEHFIPWVRTKAGPDTTIIFQQDNASAHTAHGSCEALDAAFAELRQEGMKIYRLGHWPANSPDLSPIESVWCVMKSILRRLRRMGLPLWMAFWVAHYQLDRPSFIDKLWVNWERVLHSCIMLRGGNHHQQTRIRGPRRPPRPDRAA